jgi:intimin
MEDRMKKIFILFILLALSLFAFNCGGGSGSSSSPKGENPGEPSLVQLLPAQFIAQTNARITLHAKVLDGNGAPVNNIPVNFTNLSPIGVLSALSAKTNTAGIATVTLKSTTSGFSTVQAEINKGVSQVRDRKTVFFSSFSTSQSIPSLDLTADNYELFQTTTDNEAIITATVFDGFGQRVIGMDVLFGSDSEEATFPLGSIAMTDTNGQASVLIRVIPSTLRALPTVINITALADNGAFNIVSLTLSPVSIQKVEVFANPQSVDSDGTSAITAQVTTTAGTPAPDGTSVNFTANIGGIEPFSQTTDGIATTEFTAPEVTTNDTASITAKVGTKSDFVDVDITAPVIPPAALSISPPTVSTVTGICSTFTFFITGGSPQYTISSTNITRAFNDNGVGAGTANNCIRDGGELGIWNGASITVSVPATATAGTSTLNVSDSAGGSATATITIQ